MIRQIILAAAAAALIASPATAEESIRIATAGKTLEQVNTEIRAAARALCTRQSVGATLVLHAYASCYSHAVGKAKAQLVGKTLAAAPAQQVLAKN